jgi:hypothetical protein
VRIMPRVWNKRNPNVPPDAVYVGRPTKFGNPFTHLKGCSLAKFYMPTRAAAIAAYCEWLRRDPANAELLAAVKSELRGKDLVCWCAPKACHADVLLEIANS